MHSRPSRSPFVLAVLVCSIGLGLLIYVQPIFGKNLDTAGCASPQTGVELNLVKQLSQKHQTVATKNEQQTLMRGLASQSDVQVPYAPPMVYEFEMEKISAMLDSQPASMIDSDSPPFSGQGILDTVSSPDVVNVSHTAPSREFQQDFESENANEHRAAPASLPSQPASAKTGTKPVVAKKSAKKNKRATTWTPPTILTLQIEKLNEVHFLQQWAQQTLQQFDQLMAVDGIDDPAVATVLVALDKQRQSLTEITNRFAAQANDPTQIALVKELRRIDYRIGRRLAIWYGTHRLASKANEASPLEYESAAIVHPASARKVRLDVHPMWHDYLLVDEAESVFNSLNASESRQQKMARRILSRAYSPVLTQTQLQFIAQSLGPEVADFLTDKASGPADFAEMLASLERHEARESGLTAYRLNAHYQNLLWSKDPDYKHLASHLETHYRNANARIAVSEDLLNRLIPQMPSTNEPISERIQGADVVGRNQIHNEVRVKLIPDPAQIHMDLETQGEVHSVTRARKGAFAVDNRGTTKFQVFKRLAFGRNGVFSDKPVAVSSADQQIIGINSKLDSFPILGRVARRIAKQKVEADAPAAERLVRKRVESTASQRIEQEVETQLNQATEFLQQDLLQPLIAMDLEPDAHEMSTTDEEIVIRYRLAGRDQMAANTARPSSVRGSLYNMQFHQSAMNNFIMRVDLKGETFSTQELVDHLEEILGVQISSEDTNHEAEFVFAQLDPIRVDFQNDRVTISLNLKSFRLGKGKRWINLSVKSTYVPQVTGSAITLVQEKPGLNLTGKNLKLRDQLAVRTIFEALFKGTYQFQAIPTQLASRLNSSTLAISQLEIDNGWVGISVSDPEGPSRQRESGRAGHLLRRRR